MWRNNNSSVKWKATGVWEELICTIGFTVIKPLVTCLERGGATYSGFVWMWELWTLSFWRKKAINHFSRTQLAFRVELTQNLIGEFSHQRRTASLGQSKAGHWSIALSKGGCKHCLNLRRQHFAEWTASTATNAFVWSTFQSTSVTNHECTRFNLVDQEIFHRFLSCLGLQTLLDFLYILSRKPSLLSLLSNEQWRDNRANIFRQVLLNDWH